MNRFPTTPVLLMLLLFVACFTLTGWIEPKFQQAQRNQSQDVMTLLLGDGRRIFANHFYKKADEYFHSGFYPTIFDNHESFKTPHIAADSGESKDENTGEETAFMGPPRDFLERFGRNFIPNRHTHLDQGGAEGTNAEASDLGDSNSGEVREILPWLKISAELDPNRIETYTVTAYWLRKRMGKVDEAEDFLREGLRANPYNPALLFELGCIYQEDRKDDTRARNIWELGVTKLDQQKTALSDSDEYILFRLTLYLARLEEKHENWARAAEWLQRVKPLSPNPDEIAKQLAEDQQKAAQTGASGTNAPPNF